MTFCGTLATGPVLWEAPSWFVLQFLTDQFLCLHDAHSNRSSTGPHKHVYFGSSRGQLMDWLQTPKTAAIRPLFSGQRGASSGARRGCRNSSFVGVDEQNHLVR